MKIRIAGTMLHSERLDVADRGDLCTERVWRGNTILGTIHYRSRKVPRGTEYGWYGPRCRTPKTKREAVDTLT